MASSNPFRRKGQPEATSRFPPIEAIDAAGTQSQIQIRTDLRVQTQQQQQPTKSSMRAESSEPTQYEETKAKVVKKVRVLSPPPRSPDSPVWHSNAPPTSTQSFDEPVNEYDPFDSSSSDESDRHSNAATSFQQSLVAQSSSQPPPNPFSKTLQDIEGQQELEQERIEEGEVLKAANASRATLNVDSFRRLLMTGAAESDRPTPPPQDIQGGGQEIARTETAPTPRSLEETLHAERRDISHKAAKGQIDDDKTPELTPDSTTVAPQTQQEKKSRQPPPPPPNSRHGRSLKSDSRQNHSDDNADDAGHVAPADNTKPLPPSPARRSLDDAAEAPLDHDSAGRVSEQPEQQQQANMTPAPALAPGSSKKTAPVPPPRRGHSRAESKHQLPEKTPGTDELSPPVGLGDETPPRSSIDSITTLSRAESQRSGANPPAPPPPRRLQPGPRLNAHTPSPSVSSSSVPTVPAPPPPHHEPEPHSEIPDGIAAQDSPAKLSAPPPPPTRKASTRRPMSVAGVDGVPRRVSGESRSRDSMPPPPPPPPRQRGSSPSSMEAGQNPDVKGSAEAAPEPGPTSHILADLEALQREVDALRGQFR